MDWPIKINVRRTTVIDDNNKEILTTAMGRGYESQEYVLGSAVSAKQAELEIAISERDSTIARLREENDDLNQRYHLLASEMVYEGNSVQHWKQKALAYKKCAGFVCEVRQLLIDL